MCLSLKKSAQLQRDRILRSTSPRHAQNNTAARTLGTSWIAGIMEFAVNENPPLLVPTVHVNLAPSSCCAPHDRIQHWGPRQTAHLRFRRRKQPRTLLESWLEFNSCGVTLTSGPNDPQRLRHCNCARVTVSLQERRKPLRIP